MLFQLSVYWSMIHVILLFVLLFRSHYSKRKTIWLSVLGMGALMLGNGIALAILGRETMGKLFFFTCSVPSFIFFYVLSEDKRFRFLLTFCLADTTCIWIMVATNLIDFYFGGGQHILLFITRIAAFPLLEYVVYRYLRKPYLELQDGVENGWGIFAGMTLLYYVLLVVVSNYPTNIIDRPEDVLSCVLILVLMIFNYALLFSALYKQLLLYRKQQSERVLLERQRLLEAQLENQQYIRKMKHDMKAHAVALSGLLAAQKYPEASDYLKNFKADIDSAWGQYSSNTYVNAVLSYYVQKLEKINTRLKIDIQIGEEQLPYMALCQILSNGLDNALTALEKIEESERFLSLQMKYKKDYLLIRMKNSCDKGLNIKKGKIPKTSQSGLDHGFGLQTIRKMAKELNGEMTCYTENKCFILDVMLNVKGK